MSDSACEMLFYGMYYGVLLTLFFYSVISFIYTKQKALVYFALYVLASAFMYLNINGVVNGINIDDRIKRGLFLSSHYITTMVAIAFIVNSLNLQKKLPHFSRVLYFLLYAGFVLILLEFVVPYAGFMPLPLYGSVCSFSLLVTLIVSAKKGHKEARLFLVAWVILLLAGVAYSLYLANKIPDLMIFRNGMQAGSALQMILLGFAFGHRMHRFQIAERESRLKAKYNKERFKNVAKISSDWFFELDSNLTFLYVSSGCRRHIGYPAKELIGMNFCSILHDNNGERKKIEEQFSLENGVRKNECRLRHKNGNARWAQVATIHIVHPLKRWGDVKYRGSVSNIHKKKLSEQQIDRQRVLLIQSSKLSALGEMSAGVAHEINNPLGIISFINQNMLAMSEKNKMTPEKLADFISKSERNVKRISQIISSLKTFSRDSSEVPLTLINTREIIDETMDLCSEMLARRQIQMSVEAEDCLILAQGSQISQVLLNLIQNAQQAIAQSENRWINLRVYKENSEIYFSIENSGPLISAEICDKIFDPFFTTKPVGEGTGLGLSISKGIVESHGGKIWVEPRREHTLFVFSVPCHESLAK